MVQSVCRWATGWTAGVRFRAEAKRYPSIPQLPDRLWGPPSLLFNGHRGVFP
jgi:hypothetical protein